MVIKKDSVIMLFLAATVISAAISYSNFYLFHLTFILLSLYFLYGLWKNRLTFKLSILQTRYHLIFYFMFVWYLVTLFWTIDLVLTVTYLFYIFFGMTISLVIVYYSSNNIEKINKVYKVLAIFFTLEIVFCLLEAFTSFRLPISPYSQYNHLFGRTGSSDPLIFQASAPTGFRWNPNNLGVTLVILLPFFLYNSKRLVKIVGSIAVLVLIIYSESRANFIGSLVVIFMYFFLTNRKRTLIYGMIFGSFLILFSVLAAPAFESSDSYQVRRAMSSFNSLKLYFSSSYTEGHGSIGTRKQLIDRGIEGLINTYGIGVGGGASKALDSVGGTESMHNFWVELLVEGGVLFFLIFITWYSLLTLSLWRVSKLSVGRIKEYSSALFLSMTAFVFAAVSASSVIYYFPMWIMFGFSIAVINNYKHEKRIEYLEQSDHTVQ